MKIRIWHKPSNRWLNPEKTYIRASDGAVFEYEADYGGTFSSHEQLWQVKDCVIQLFTGLKDANGRDIYCGDLLQDQDGGISEVYLGDGAFRIRYSELNDRTLLADTLLDKSDIVIGDILEYPVHVKIK